MVRQWVKSGEQSYTCTLADGEVVTVTWDTTRGGWDWQYGDAASHVGFLTFDRASQSALAFIDAITKEGGS